MKNKRTVAKMLALACLLLVSIMCVSTVQAAEQSSNKPDMELSATAVVASGKCGDNLKWVLDNEGVMTISGTGAMWDYRDDNSDMWTFDYHVCPWENQKDNIKKVIFKDGITLVGASAFFECKNLQKVTFADTITTISVTAFANCKSLENFILPKNLKRIGQEAFAYCPKITSVTIPDTVTFYDSDLFSCDTSLSYLYIGGSADAEGYIYSSGIARDCTKLEEIHVSPDNGVFTEIDGMLYSKDKTVLVQYPCGRKVKEVKLPVTTTSLGDVSMEQVQYMEKLILPEGLLTIEDLALRSCPELKYLTVPSTVTRIGEDLGMDCHKLIWLENKSAASWEVTNYGLFYTDASGKEKTSVAKDEKVYQHIDVYQFEMDKTAQLAVGKTKTVLKGCEANDEIITFKEMMESDKDNFVFTSSDSRVATVDAMGRVTAVAPGEATIKVSQRYHKAGRKAVTASCKVTVKEASVTAKQNISKASVARIRTQVYNGKAKTPSVVVKMDGVRLRAGTDYTVSYRNNRYQGKATATINGKGRYTGTKRVQFTIAAPKGSTYTINGMKYKITNSRTDGTGTVRVMGTTRTKSRLTSLTIGSTVKIGGKSYRITEIYGKAFTKCKNLKKVVIGTNMKKIGTSAFEGDSKLQSIRLRGKNLTYVGKNAVKGISSKAKITVPSSRLKNYKKLFTKGTGYRRSMKITR